MNTISFVLLKYLKWFSLSLTFQKSSVVFGKVFLLLSAFVRVAFCLFAVRFYHADRLQTYDVDDKHDGISKKAKMIIFFVTIIIEM